VLDFDVQATSSVIRPYTGTIKIVFADLLWRRYDVRKMFGKPEPADITFGSIEDAVDNGTWPVLELHQDIYNIKEIRFSYEENRWLPADTLFTIHGYSKARKKEREDRGGVIVADQIIPSGSK
jgi:hypothetical protein